VCVISPQRLGLCGAYNWLDGKAAFEIDPNGPNQPIVKGECLDPVKGQWRNVNDFVYNTSNRGVERFNAYSLMEDPMTSCGCFECIVTVLPDGQSVMVVNREYAGETPLGMQFSTLASSVGGGNQTPGFLGVGRLYITSPKFISAEGGLPRIAWMPKELKEAVQERLQARADELEMPDFVGKIADETVTTDFEGLMNHMMAVEHPALAMPPLLG
jgi:acetyl-CoA synthase